MDSEQNLDDVPDLGQRGIPAYGSIIRQQRRAKNLTQEQLAQKAGCDPRVVIKAERSGTVSLKKLHRLADALDVTVGMIANLDGDNKRSSTNAVCEVTVKFLLPAAPLLNRKERNEFIKALKAALEPFNNLSFEDLRQGSVLIDFRMTLATLNALCIAVDYEALPEFAIEWIMIRKPVWHFMSDAYYTFYYRGQKVAKYANAWGVPNAPPPITAQAPVRALFNISTKIRNDLTMRDER